MLPSKTLASRQEKSAPGHKRSKERLTIMTCSNASDNHKIPLMVIGKSAHPRALKVISPKALPVYYKSQKSAWMDATLFTNWFKEEFVPSVTKFLKRTSLPIKAILLGGTMPPLTLEDSTWAKFQAWDSVRGSTIQKSWSKVIDIEDYNDSEDDIPLNELALKWKSRGEMSCTNLNERGEEESLLELMQNLKGCKNVTRQDVDEWVTADDLEEEMNIEEIANAFLSERLSSKNQMTITMTKRWMNSLKPLRLPIKVLLLWKQL
ncbi:jerky protein homolog-like [Sitophilus oryzae]|uniref:Jerky protein homolog-like n=1 Tax=Sitophilus oryzae TaxID=7048 RepID=A0A6J2YK94_SITOR|nr:jerky protein homolog-like [Sitophilus oryzae]